MKKLTVLLLLIVSTNVFAWSLFSPKDFEECRDEAAREAKNKDAMHILIKSCAQQFPARRNPEGGYQYYIGTLDNIDYGYINVSDPKLTKSDWVEIKKFKQVKQDFIHAEEEASYQAWLIKNHPEHVKNKN